MALQSFKNGASLPPQFNVASGYSSYILNASGEKLGGIFHVPKTGTINKVGFRTGAVTNAETLRVSIQTVVSGAPSGTLYGGSAAGTQSNPAANTFYEVTLGTGATATEGDTIAVVVEFDSDFGDLEIVAVNVIGNQAFPFVDHYTSSWSPAGRIPCMSLGYNDGSYESCDTIPASSITAINFDSDSTPDEYAMKFNFPFKCRATGMWILGDFDYNTDVVLYDTDGTTVIDTVTIQQSERGVTVPAYTIKRFTPRVLNAGATYRLSIKPATSGASDVTIYKLTMLTSAMMGCLPGGTNITMSSRTESGTWQEDSTSRIVMGIYFDQLSNDGGAVYTVKLDYDSNNNPIYIGLANIGAATSIAVWQIRKIDYDENNDPISVTWADGTDGFEKVWDNRTAYSYS